MKNLLKDQEVKEYIAEWFKKQPTDKSEIFWESLQKKKNSQLKDLAKNPILLNALCQIADLYFDIFSLSHTRIYCDIFTVLLQEFYLGQKLDLLSKVAYKFFSTNKPNFKEYKLLLTAQGYVDDCLGMSDLDVFELVNKFCCQGILSKEDDIYFFSHVSLQEFLTAKYIYENDLIEKCILENIADPRYFNVFLFLVEMLKMKTDNFLVMIYAYYKGSKNLYVKDLLLECKQRAIYVNKNVWQLIEKITLT